MNPAMLNGMTIMRIHGILADEFQPSYLFGLSSASKPMNGINGQPIRRTRAPIDHQPNRPSLDKDGAPGGASSVANAVWV